MSARSSTGSCATRATWKPLGIGVVAISSNDAATYPDDSFANMQAVAREMAFPFPYLHDEARPSRGPTAPSARPISSGSTPQAACSIAAASTRAARTPGAPTPAAISSRACGSSPRRVRDLRNRSRRWAARSSGRRPDRENPTELTPPLRARLQPSRPAPRRT